MVQIEKLKTELEKSITRVIVDFGKAQPNLRVKSIDVNIYREPINLGEQYVDIAVVNADIINKK